MNILIVEDNPAKASTVSEFLTGVAGCPVELIKFSDNLSDAIRMLNQSPFELVVLDLMLPYLRDGLAASEAGVELLHQLRNGGGQNEGCTVLGLSAYLDEVEIFRSQFGKLGVLITPFDETDEWKQALSRIVSDVAGRAGRRKKLDFIVFVALDEERDGFAHTDILCTGDSSIGGLNVRYVKIEAEPPILGAVVRLRQMGLVGATLDVTTALSLFNVPIVCMSGICAGFGGRIELGQLVVASPAWEYQAGKWSTNGFEIAPSQIPLRPMTRVLLEQTLSGKAFIDSLESGLDRAYVRPSRPSEPTLAPAASGSAVIADQERLAHIEQQHRKIAALDMETFGVYYAAYEAAQFVQHFFSVKCVVDLADGSKNDDLHSYGCAVAARASVSLVRALLGR